MLNVKSLVEASCIPEKLPSLDGYQAIGVKEKELKVFFNFARI
tara:strand:- start:5015 stop:5143 length:129 start_codon:yes stop_codon:yes gene_type:complete